MLSLRNNSLVPYDATQVSAKAVGLANGMTFPMFLRALLDKRDMSRVSRIGINISTPTDRARDVVMPDVWFERVFMDVDGVAGFFRQMSGGRRYIEWSLYSKPLLSTAQKAAADASEMTIAAYRNAASATGSGIPVGDFDRFIWVVDDGVSTMGTTSSDSIVGAIDFCVQTTAHESTHAFGVHYHADVKKIEYGDLFCLMGSGGGRGFSNPRLAVPNGGFSNGLDGPGICAPYLLVAGWLDYKANVVGIEPSALAQNTGSTLTTLAANQGAPPPGSSTKIAMAIGNIPTQAADPPQYWIEYRHPSGYDRGINLLFNASAKDFPDTGVLALREVRIDTARGTQLHSFLLSAVGAVAGQTLAIAALNIAVRIVDVQVARKSIVVAMDRTA